MLSIRCDYAGFEQMKEAIIDGLGLIGGWNNDGRTTGYYLVTKLVLQTPILQGHSIAKTAWLHFW
jgi:hypothetical protein